MKSLAKSSQAKNDTILRVNIIVVSKTLQIHIRSLHFFVMIVFYAFITLCTVKSGLLEQCVYCVHNQF